MSKQIHIIGGGVIGLCSAWYLSKEGYDVTIIDSNTYEDGTSHGNAGMVVPSHFIPMASPGVITKGIKWMFDSKSPFYVKPRMNIELAQWLWHFYRSSTENKASNAMSTLYEFNEWSKELYREMHNDDFAFHFEQKGLLMLYRTKTQEAEEVEMAEKAHDLGIEANILDEKELKSLEPNIKLEVLGGVHYPGDAHLHPNVFMSHLVSNLKDKKVNFIQGRVDEIKLSNGNISAVLLDNKATIKIEKLILSGGSWTSHLLKKIGIKMLLQDGKGYSYTLPNLHYKPNMPTILTEAKVAITPMGTDLRIGGTLELGGFSQHINRNRLRGIIESVDMYYPTLNLPNPKIDSVWKGYRPCTPDGLPYIGKVKNIDNLIIATGHGMMGMSLGPATGKLVSEIATGNDTTIATDLFKVERFS
jgi:D-amino-acid dehydrogenase